MINQQEKSLLTTLAGIFALRMFGLCMLLPIFSIEAMHYTGANMQLIGLAAGIYGFAQALLQVPFGWLSDRYGRKPLLLLGITFIMLGSFVGAGATSIYTLIIGRVLQGCGAVGSVILATLTENVREQVRPQAMAILGAVIGIAFALAIVLGTWLNAKIGLSGIFWVIGGVASICIPLVMKLPIKNSSARKHKFSWDFVTIPLLSLNMGVFILHASLAALFLILPTKLQASGIALAKTWQLYLVVITLAMVVAWKFIAKRDQKNIAKIQTFAIFSLLCSEVLLYIIEGWFGIAVVMTIFFSAFCVLEASLPALVAKYVNAHNRGIAMGMYSCLQFFGVFLGGAVGGWLHANFGMHAVLSLCVSLVMIWLLINMLSLKPRGRLGVSSPVLSSEGLSD